MTTRRFLLFWALLLCCGDGTQKSSDSLDAAPTQPDALPTTCTRQGITRSTQAAERDTDLGVLFYTATAGAPPNLQRLTFDFYFSLGAADGPQDVSFSGVNLKDCTACLMIRRGCESSSCKDGTIFLAQAGSANISALGDIGTAFRGSLSNVVFSEVTINPSELSTTLVPGGETWCIDSYPINTPITAPR